MGDIEELSE
jgi:ABC-type multidrug transport system fused ATPase/permease subunit